MDVIEVLKRYVAVDLDGADLGGVRDHLSDLGRIRAWVDARTIAATRRMDDLGRSGVAVHAEQELVLSGRATRREADQVVARFAALELVPDLGASLEDGTVTGAHVDALGRGLRKLEPDQRAQFVDDEGARLARIAKRMTPDQYAKHVNDTVALALVDGGIANLERQKQAIRYRSWTDQITGMYRFSGELDPESGLKLDAKIRAQIEALFHNGTPEHCPNDPSAKQDHLAALAFLAVVDGRTGPTGRPEFIVVVDEHTLRSGLHEQSIIDLGDPNSFLPVETLRRHACFADIIPAVLGTDGVLRDLGRSSRLASKEQRRAARAMYPSCGVHGCRVPFDHCDLHHIRYWENGGDTDMDNLVPLCSKHHHAAHEGGWHLSLHPTTRVLTITFPDGTVQAHAPPRARAG